jgi:hypothetical protein
MRIKQAGVYKSVVPYIKIDGIYKKVDISLKSGGVYKDIVRDYLNTYNFDGIDDYGVLANRAIDPNGDIVIEFVMPDNVAAGVERTIISQNITNTTNAREFTLFISAVSGNLGVTFGGATYAAADAGSFSAGDLCRLSLIGSTSTLRNLTRGTNTIRSFTRGVAREPNAQTVIGARTNGVIGSFAAFFSGIQRDVTINGITYPIDDSKQAVQLPEPSGLGAEILINPQMTVAAANWSKDSITVSNLPVGVRLTNTRPSYAGGVLQTFATTQGVKYVVRIKVNGISTTTPATTCRVSVNTGTTGIYTGSLYAANHTVDKQYLFLVFTADAAQATLKIMANTAEQSGYVEISDVTLKPLGTCNPLTLRNTNPDRWQEVSV